jgi:serine protease Do
MALRRTGILCCLAAMVFLAVGGHVGTAQSSKPAEHANVVGQQAGEALDADFHVALKAFSEKQWPKAAAQINDAARYLQLKARQATGESKTELSSAADELRSLGSEVEKGAVTDETKLKDAFADAHHALAQAYHEQAATALAHKDTHGAGQDLKQAATELEKALTWAGHKIAAETAVVIADAKTWADSLLSGSAGADGQEAQKKIENLGVEIRKTGKSSSDPASAKAVQQPPPSQTANLTTAVEWVAQHTIPAVVHVEIKETKEVANPMLPFEQSPFFRHFFHLPKKMPKKFKRELFGLGTGMIMDIKGHILTNNHVVAGADKIEVVLANGNSYQASVVGTDPMTDLAVIKISAEGDLPCVTFGDSDQVQVGQWVVAIGQPRGLSETVTQGIISAKHRRGITNPSSYEDFLQTDAAINPGNSGGPLLTLQGEVIGVNAAIISKSGGFEGIGFAIPSNMAVHVAGQLIQHGKVIRGWIGLVLQELTPDLAKSFGLKTPQGARVADVLQGAPADKAGIERGDIILTFDGKDVSDAATLRDQVANTAVGKEVPLTVLRKGEKKELTVKVASMDEAAKLMASALRDRLGADFRPVTKGEAEKYHLPAQIGVAVTDVETNGPLGKVGFVDGDLILEVEGKPVEGVEGFVAMIEMVKPHQQIKLLALDHKTGRTGYVQVTVQ